MFLSFFQLVDLHVYLVPPEIWREKFNNALNQNINDTVSLGFIRLVSCVKFCLFDTLYLFLIA